LRKIGAGLHGARDSGDVAGVLGATEKGIHVDNQTKDEWVSLYSAELGTGVFLIADPTTNDEEKSPKKVLVPGLAYKECVKRGALTIAFKWVPDAISTHAEITAHSCGTRECVDRCVDDECICDRATGRCK
jgi:hypothetical protein